MKTLAFGVPSVLIVTLSSINAVSATTYTQPASAATEVSGQELAKGSTQAGAAAKQLCLPFLGCVQVPVPAEIKRPVEGFLQHQIYNALANALGEGIPITSSANQVFPNTNVLPGGSFQPKRRIPQISSDGLMRLKPGDYNIPVDLFCMKQRASSPSGHRYLLAPLKGKMAEVITALNARAVGTGIPRQSLQVLSWNIQGGMKYEEMSSENRQIVDRLLPDYKRKLSRSLLEEIEVTYNQLAGVAGLPSLDSALGRLGDVGKTINSFRQVRQDLIRHGDDYSSLARLFITPGNSNARGGSANTPWSKISDRVYGRMVTEGNVSSPGELQLRVLPTSASPVEINITSLVADPQNSNIQPLTASPKPPTNTSEVEEEEPVIAKVSIIYPDSKSLGMAQVLQRKTENLSDIETLHRAREGKYDTINIPRSDFLEKTITYRMGCNFLSSPCSDDKKISYADYIKLKMKIRMQLKFEEKGKKIYDNLSNYRNRLEGDRQYGGQAVAKKIVSLENEGLDKINLQLQQRQNRVRSAGNIWALGKDALSQGLKLAFGGAKFDFDIAPAALRFYLRAKGFNPSQVEQTILPNVSNDKLTGSVDYVVKVADLVPKISEALLQNRPNQLENLFFEVASETASLYKNERGSGILGISPHLAKAMESYQESQEMKKLLSELERLNIIDERDRSYIEWSIKSLEWDFLSSVASLVEDIVKSAVPGEPPPWLAEFDNIHKAIDSLKSGCFNARDALAEAEIRRDYEKLIKNYNETQIRLSAFAEFIDSAAYQVGEYLVIARRDVVTRRTDGTIPVITDSVLYPPNP